MTRTPKNLHHLSRRSFLRGVGVSMALPWLESLPVWGDEPAGEAPVRSRSSSPATATTAANGGPAAKDATCSSAGCWSR